MTAIIWILFLLVPALVASLAFGLRRAAGRARLQSGAAGAAPDDVSVPAEKWRPAGKPDR